MSSAVVLGVTGIIVSGIAGPAVSAWFNRQGDEQRFARDQLQRGRDDLRSILDEGAALLGAGETNLRLAHEAAGQGVRELPQVREWAGRVHLLGQRLLLRLPENDAVVVAYEAVRAALIAVGETYGNDERYPAAVATFEEKRGDFLDKARDALARTDTT